MLQKNNWINSLFILVFLTVFSPSFIWASPASLTYQGRILKSDGQGLEYNNVSFIFEITSEDGSCVIYREQKDGVNLSNSKGVFDVPIGLGTRLFPGVAGNPSYKLSDSFVNGISHPCAGSGSWNSSVDSYRKLKVQFHDGVGWRLISPDNIIRSVPFALTSLSTTRLGDKTINDFVLKSNVPVSSCSAGQVVFWDGMNFSCVTDAGGSGVISDVLAGSGIGVSGTSSKTVSVLFGTTAGTVAAGNDSRLSDGRSPVGSAAGDLGGSYPNPSVNKIRGFTVASTTPSEGQVYRYNSSNTQFEPVYFGVDDLRTSLGASQFSSNCSSSQTLTWSAVTDAFSCVNISLPVSQLTGVLGIASGGTNNSSLDVSAGGVIYTDGSKLVNVGAGSAGQVLTSNGAGAPTWSVPSASDSTKLPLLGGTMTGTMIAAVGNAAVPGVGIGANSLGLFSPGTNILGFSTSGTERMRIDALGNVGIGATSPSAVLDISRTGVKSSLKVSSGANSLELGVASAANEFYLNSVAGESVLKYNSKFNLSNGSNSILSATTGGEVMVGNSFGTSSAASTFQVNKYYNGSSGSISMSAADISLITSPSASTTLQSSALKSSFTLLGANNLISSSSAIRGQFSNQGSGVVSGIAMGVQGVTSGNANSGNYTGTAAGVVGSVTGSFGANLPAINNAVGLRGELNLSGNGTGGTTVTNFFGVDIRSSMGTSDLVTNWHGIKVFAPSGGTITNKYAIVTEPSAGNVGIGTAAPTARLDVAGEVKFGNTSSVCDATSEGQQRYNSSTKKMEFCNGTSWAAIGSTGIGSPSFDTGWIAVAQNCQTYTYSSTGLSGLPKLMSGYFKKSTGEIFPWGINQYGDSAQANGPLIDYDESNGNIYIRLPCGNANGNNVLHVGSYRDRTNTTNETIFNQTSVQFRVMVWQ